MSRNYRTTASVTTRPSYTTSPPYTRTPVVTTTPAGTTVPVTTTPSASSLAKDRILLDIDKHWYTAIGITTGVYFISVILAVLITYMVMKNRK